MEPSLKTDWYLSGTSWENTFMTSRADPFRGSFALIPCLPGRIQIKMAEVVPLEALEKSARVIFSPPVLQASCYNLFYAVISSLWNHGYILVCTCAKMILWALGWIHWIYTLKCNNFRSRQTWTEWICSACLCYRPWCLPAANPIMHAQYMCILYHMETFRPSAIEI